ncbi:hypothetical protein QBC34DRAFT_129551 [Podospora aff. communis PSN243]|uniref:Uncharacterized protein n=1 Tax=Podospora aff. communis PSN243 TaxID=3040156 RepID=A0AAV9GGE8_9PEZI|nr:hypothetical protein QBC34DRAFT_129551 [Podospora aff. communis PSN243]
MKFTTVLAFVGIASAGTAAPQGANCWRPGSYTCTPNHRGWQVCSTNYNWVYAGSCGRGQVCKYSTASKSPYCVAWNAPWPPA